MVNGSQSPDSKAGFYYVSVIRPNGDYRLLRGPFQNDHPAALAAVEPARLAAERFDPKAAFYAFGTARTDDDRGPGILDRINQEAA